MRWFCLNAEPSYFSDPLLCDRVIAVNLDIIRGLDSGVKVINDDMLINASRKVLVMLMSRMSRLAMEVLVELTGHSIRESMIASRRDLQHCGEQLLQGR